jgi:hypothetical protein
MKNNKERNLLKKISEEQAGGAITYSKLSHALKKEIEDMDFPTSVHWPGREDLEGIKCYLEQF